MGGGLGMDLDLAQVPAADGIGDHVLLFSESAGRFVVTVDPANQQHFEDLLKGLPCAAVGTVTETPRLIIRGSKGQPIIDAAVPALKAAWQQPFGDLI